MNRSIGRNRLTAFVIIRGIFSSFSLHEEIAAKQHSKEPCAKGAHMRQMGLMALGILTLFTLLHSEAEAANEQRCKDLGGNCICSEPLNTATYTTISGIGFNPADTTSSDKQCTKVTGETGAVLEDSSFRYVAINSGEALTNMPNKSASLQYFLRTKTTAEGNPGGGGQFIGHQFGLDGLSPSTVRRAWRGYLYWSSDYDLETATCVNSAKIMQVGQDAVLSAILSGASSNYQMYGWIGWNSNLDCCNKGPGGNTTWGTYTVGNVRGKWFRFEIVMTNTATTGGTTTFQIYMKNITDNLPEVTIIDSTVPTTQPVGNSWTSTIATTLKPSAHAWDQVIFDLFRRDTCAGFKAVSHIMAAAWTTDAGQRIGAAVEVEGGGSGSGVDSVPPSAPTNLKISMLTGSVQ